MLFLLSGGCKYKVNSSNPKVVYANTVFAAASADDTFTLALRAANDGLERLKATEPEYYNGLHPKLVALARFNDTRVIPVLRLAEAGDTSADWRGALLALANEAGNLDPSTFGFKNPNSRATAQVTIAGLLAIINTINTSFGGKP